MSGANVTNLEALERFRSSLVLFLERANLVLDEVGEEVEITLPNLANPSDMDRFRNKSRAFLLKVVEPTNPMGKNGQADRLANGVCD